MSSKNIKEQVLYLIDQGMSHRKIAKALGIGVASVSRIRNGKKENKLIITPTVEGKNWFYEAIKEHQKFEQSYNDESKGKQYPFAIVDDYSHNDAIEAKIQNKLQPYKLLVNKDNEVDVVDEELSALDRILEKLEKRGITIGGIDYQALRQHKSRALDPYLDGDEGNVLVIGDIHEPVSIEGYLEFCREQQELWNCGTIVFIGDIADMASWNYHEMIPEILNPTGEIALSRQRLQDRFKTFPRAKVCRGNHDLLVYRKARTAGLLREFIKNPHEIFGAPLTYEFADEFILHDVIYTHGNEGNAWKKAPIEGMNIVSGHCHTLGGVQWFRNRSKQVFGMQTGTGIDYIKENFDYAKMSAKHPILSCGIVLNGGKLPIVIPFIK